HTERLVPIDVALVEQRAHGAAIDELHDEEDLTLVRLPHVVDLDDARVPDLGHRLRLSHQAPAGVRIARLRQGQPLERDVAVELLVVRAEPLPHSAATEGRFESIPPSDT